jgi:hypothetical protein
MNTTDHLKEALQSYHNVDKVKSHLKEVNRKLDEQYARLKFLKEQMEKEYEDYAKLEKGSLKGWFYSVLGSKEKQLEKERQEYLQVTLQYDECKNSIELLEYEQEVLKKKVEDFPALKKKVKELKIQRVKELKESGSAYGKALMRINDKVDDYQLKVRDIEDALEIGRQAISLLDTMVSYLKSARNWGNWDMYSGNRGGGYWTAYQKHTNVDKAKALSYKIKFVLQRFDEELERIYGEGSGAAYQIKIEGFSKFTDIFFDNLISDWIIQQKIINALNSVRSVNDQVNRICQTLDHDAKSLQEKINSLLKEKEQIILDSAN